MNTWKARGTEQKAPNMADESAAKRRPATTNAGNSPAALGNLQHGI